MCHEEGYDTLAVELDHIIQHKGNEGLFWDINNWQGLCIDHHQRIKSRMERGGKRPGCKPNGMPLDPQHSWYQ
jgi:5-methylcytosine-specific restriction protein A